MHAEWSYACIARLFVALSRMRKLFVVVCFVMSTIVCAQAQIHLKANLQNNHLWRGMEVSDGVVLLTDLSYTMANEHVTVGLWGGCNSEGTYKEFNHYLNLKAGEWSFALWDTYNFSPGANYNNHQYWNYSAHSTGRFLDATLAYQFDRQKFPLSVSWSTLVFGRDRSTDNKNQKYSTFVYAEYPVYKNDEWKVDAGIGGAFALNKAGEDAHFFGNTAGVVHVQLQASHDLKLGQYTIPVYAKCMWNPQSNQSYFQLGAEIIHF